jgi:hypothetical protein
LPNWTLRPVIVLLLANFPVAYRVLISEQIIDYRVATMIKGCTAFDTWNETVRQLRPENSRSALVSRIATEAQRLG